MNRFLPVIMALCFVTACAQSVTAQQTPINTNCNDESTLVWNKNSESDMASYRLYSKTTAGVTNQDAVLVVIDHRTKTVVWSDEGVAQFHELFKRGWLEGAIWFAISAVDNKGNESPVGNEIGCQLDIAPIAPEGITIVESIEQFILNLIG